MENNDKNRYLTRRQFLQLSAFAGVGALTGCAVNPVDRRKSTDDGVTGDGNCHG